MNPKRLRVLVGAYAISPNRGSEPGIGWNVCTRLARHHDLTVLCAPQVPGSTADNFQDNCRAYFQQHGPIPGLSLQFVESPLLARLFQRESLLQRRTVYYAGYAAWQRAAFAVAAQLHAQQPFDLVHHLNITGYREPGYLWKLHAPFVWGPIAGAAGFPTGYFDLLSRKERLFYRMRNAINRRQQRSRRCAAAAKKASLIWAVSDADSQLVSQRWGKSAEPLRESAATVHPDAAPRDYDGSRSLRVVWSGQHIGRKALPLLLHALARLGPAFPVELTVLGDGPEHNHWRAIAAELKLTQLRWTGWIDRSAALQAVAAADVLAFTSLLEGTPQALLEAMSLGLPVICHHACGMGTAVTDDCGIRVPLANSTTSVAGFAAALRRLVEQPPEVRRLSCGALQRSVELSWDGQVDQIVAGYERVLNTSPRVGAIGRAVRGAA